MFADIVTTELPTTLAYLMVAYASIHFIAVSTEQWSRLLKLFTNIKLYFSMSGKSRPRALWFLLRQFVHLVIQVTMMFLFLAPVAYYLLHAIAPH